MLYCLTLTSKWAGLGSPYSITLKMLSCFLFMKYKKFSQIDIWSQLWAWQHLPKLNSLGLWNSCGWVQARVQMEAPNRSLRCPSSPWGNCGCCIIICRASVLWLAAQNVSYNILSTASEDQEPHMGARVDTNQSAHQCVLPNRIHESQCAFFHFSLSTPREAVRIFP